MERKIGEIFEYNGEWYQCMRVPQKHSCKLCDLRGLCCDNGVKIVTCAWRHREDNTSVIFKKLEKIGESMKIHGRLVLKVKADARQCMGCCFYSKFMCELTMEECVYYDCGEGTKFVEIKQTKEDMEENKLNLKPFDIQKAREGKPVCTRDGRKARIICFDRDWDMHIVALVTDPLGESVHYYLSNGKVDFDKQNDEDLMMLPEKKEGWINLCKNNHGDTLAVGVFPNREEAVSNCPPSYLGTIKIEWEE